MARIQYTQEQIEELKEHVLSFRLTDPEKAYSVCEMLEEYAKQHNDPDLLGFSYFYIGEMYYIRNEFEEMFEIIAKSVIYLSDTQQWRRLARAYNMMAITSINKGHIPVAVDYYLSALKCAREHDLQDIQCSININLGYLYMQTGIYKDAQDHLLEALRLCLNTEHENTRIIRLTMIYTNLANCYILQKDSVQAGIYIDKINAECRSHFTNMECVYVGCMEARYYDLCKEYEKRNEQIETILSRMDDSFPVLDVFDDVLSLCQMTLNNKQYDTFIILARKLKAVVENSEMIYMEKQIYSLIIEYYRAENETAKLIDATAHFYDLTRIIDSEGRQMIANMLYIRTQLEKANETKQKIERENALLHKRSVTDPLTGIANRFGLTEYMQNALEECESAKKKLAFEILDVDFFKEYNDTYGHQAGDSCLINIVSAMKKIQNDHIFCARYGGDEFILLYVGMDEQEVADCARKLKEEVSLQNMTIDMEAGSNQVSISQGICYDIPIRENKSWDFLHIADEYLYLVKKNGKNGICIGNLHKEYEFL